MESIQDATAARDRFVANLQIPSWFHAALGAAVTVQIATAAIGISRPTGPAVAWIVAGIVVLAVVGVALVRDFQRRNGVRLHALTSRVVLGGSNLASTAYAAGLAAAVWGALTDHAWLVPVAAVLGGLGYAAAGVQWWRRYRREPSSPTFTETPLGLAALGLVAVAALVALMIGR